MDTDNIYPYFIHFFALDNDFQRFAFSFRATSYFNSYGVSRHRKP